MQQPEVESRSSILLQVWVCVRISLTEWRDILNIESHLKDKPGWLTHSSDWLRGGQPGFDSR
jgi:hypothetical protein